MYGHHQAYTYALPIKILRDHNQITDISEKYQTSPGTQFNLTLCDLPFKRLLASKCNEYILKYLQHTLWTPSSIHLRSTHQNPQRSQLNHRHFRKLSDFSRNIIQFDTLRLPIKRLLASKCNKYILKYLQHTLWTPSSITYALPIKILRDHNQITDISEKYQTSRGTQFDLTLCDLLIKRLLASKCNRYILKYLQHTLWTPSSIHLRSTHQNPQRSQLNQRHFRKLSDFSRKTIQFDTLRLPIKTLLASKRNQIYSEASSTHISAHHQAYTHALPIKILRDHN